MLSSRQNQHSNLSPASPEGEELKPPSPAEGPPNTTIYTLNESRSTFNVGFGGGAEGGGGEQPQKNTLSFRRGLSGHADYYANQGEVSGHADYYVNQGEVQWTCRSRRLSGMSYPHCLLLYLIQFDINLFIAML